MKKKKVVIYVPAYCLYLYDPSRLTCVSLQTALRGIDLMKNGIGDEIVFSTGYETWRIEAELKKSLAKKSGIEGDDLVKIIPGVTATYVEAQELSKIVADPDAKIIVSGQKYHVKRAAIAIRYFFKDVEIVKVSTKMERMLDPSWLKSVLCSSSLLNFIIYNWVFNLITPWMMRRQMRKEGR